LTEIGILAEMQNLSAATGVPFTTSNRFEETPTFPAAGFNPRNVPTNYLAESTTKIATGEVRLLIFHYLNIPYPSH
jgi:hypothetical protein